MAETMTFEDFAAQVRDVGDPAAEAQAGQASQLPGAGATNEISLAPLTRQQAQASRQKFEANQAARGRPQKSLVREMEQEDLGRRPGVPFDMEQGDSQLRHIFAKMPTPAEGLFALNQHLRDKGGTARLNKFGDPVVTMTQDGKERDYLLNAPDIDVGDVRDFATREAGPVIGSMVGATATALATKGVSMGPPLVDAAIKIFTMAVGTTAGEFVGGSLQDVQARHGEGKPAQFGEIGARRGQQALVSGVMELGMGVAGRAAGFLWSPMMAARPFEILQAQERLANRFGIEIPLSVGEATGSRLALKSEAYASRIPGASTAFEGFNTRRAGTIRTMRDIAEGRPAPGGMGPPPPPPAADLEGTGRRILGAVGGEAAPIEHAVARTARAAETTARSEVIGGLNLRNIDQNVLGEDLRQAAHAERAARIGPNPPGVRSQADALYDVVHLDPRTQVKNIAGDPLATQAQAIRQRLPSVDEHGVPVTLERLVPSHVIPLLEELERGAGQQFRLDELMTMRNTIRNQIAVGEAVPGYQSRYLNEMNNMLTTRIQTGLRAIDPNLETAWQTANDFYAAQARRFETSGIAEMFRTPQQGNFVPGIELVNKATTGQKAQHFYNAYRDFFGAGSPQMDQLRAAVRDDLLQRKSLSETLDAAGFVKRLDDLARDNPQMLDDVLGRAQATQLRESANVYRAARGETLPRGELEEAIRSGNLSGQRLVEMQAAEATRTARYRNTLLRAINDGSFGPEQIKPTEVVDRLVFHADTQPSDLREIMGMMGTHPEAAEDIRRLTFKKVLDDATVRRSNGIDTIDANALREQLRDPKLRPKLQAVLGTGRIGNMDDLQDIATIFAPSSQAFKEFAGAAGLAGGSWIGGLMRTGDLKYLGQAGKNLVLATIYTSNPLRRWLTNQSLTRQGKEDFANLLIGSGPFIRAVTETYGHEASVAFQVEAKQSIDRSHTEQEAPVIDLQDFENRVKQQNQPQE